MEISKEVTGMQFVSTIGKQLNVAGAVGRTQARVGIIQRRLQSLIELKELELQTSFDDHTENSLRYAIEMCDTIVEDIKDIFK